jgi:hypothetical protein
MIILLVCILHLVEPISMSHEVYHSSVVPIDDVYSFSLCLSNSAYIYLSISFI